MDPQYIFKKMIDAVKRSARLSTGNHQMTAITFNDPFLIAEFPEIKPLFECKIRIAEIDCGCRR